jgi:hypothetical protein
VSGPGELSKRTDGAQPAMEMTGGAYGENAELMGLQTAAPMSQVETNPSQMAPASAPSGMPVTPLFAPSQRPEEPLTAGMPFGPGAMSAPRMPVNSSKSLRETLNFAMQQGFDPELEYIYANLSEKGII